jgi:hypothetical protein
MDPDLLPDTHVLLFAVVAVLFVLALLWVRNHSDFVIRVRRGEVRCRGRVPLAQTRGLREFLLDDLAVRDGVTIRGRWQGGRLRVWCSGNLTRGQQQRVRNFLLTRL